MVAPNTGTLLYNPANGKNRTAIGLSTNIVIKVGPSIVGAIKSISVNEARQIGSIYEVGTDGIIDSTPTSAATVDGACNRVRFDRMRMAEAFGRGFIHLKSQRFPFDIEIIDKWLGDGNNSIVTTIKNVWIKSINVSYEDNNFMISESMNWQAEDISSVFSGTSNNVATGGEINRPLAINEIERATDRGDRRGAMDAPNLIRSFTEF